MFRFPKSLGIVMATVLVASLGMGMMMSLPSVVYHLSYAAESGQAQAARDDLQAADQISYSFRTAAKALRPSVVSVRSVRTVTSGGFSGEMPELPEEFRRFFGPELDGLEGFERFEGRRRAPRKYQQKGLGTGVILSQDGLIVTNSHVVADADKVEVTLSDRRIFHAEVIGTDKRSDVAVIKIDAANLKAAALGDSDKMEVGDWVLAIGSPFGLDQTVTSGIVSAKGRSGVGITDYEEFLQTDAAINPGNSGGPLVNLRGEVIGINTAIASRSGGNVGVGFSIPSNMVRQIMDSIVEDGDVERGWLGAVIQDLNEDLARSFGYNGRNGVLIGDVLSGGPAAKSGLKAGDIVIQLEGKPVNTSNQLRNRIAATQPGGRVTLEIFRDGRSRKLSVVLGDLDRENKPSLRGSRSKPGEEAEQSESLEDLGLRLERLTEQLAKRYGHDPRGQGVLVAGVESGSPADAVGLQTGDLITHVGSRRVSSPTQFRSAAQQQTGRGVLIRVQRDGVSRFAFLERQAKK